MAPAFPCAKPGVDERTLSDEFRAKDEAIRQHLLEHGQDVPRRRESTQPKVSVDLVNGQVPHVVAPKAARLLRKQALAQRFTEARKGLWETKGSYRKTIVQSQSTFSAEEGTTSGGARSHDAHADTGRVATIDRGAPFPATPFPDSGSDIFNTHVEWNGEQPPEDPFSDENAYDADGEVTSETPFEDQETISDADSTSSVATSLIGRLLISPSVSEPFTDSSTPPKDPARWFRALPLGLFKPKAKKPRAQTHGDELTPEQKRQRAAAFVQSLESCARRQIMREGPKAGGVGRRFIWGGRQAVAKSEDARLDA